MLMAAYLYIIVTKIILKYDINLIHEDIIRQFPLFYVYSTYLLLHQVVTNIFITNYITEI